MAPGLELERRPRSIVRRLRRILAPWLGLAGIASAACSAASDDPSGSEPRLAGRAMSLSIEADLAQRAALGERVRVLVRLTDPALKGAAAPVRRRAVAKQWARLRKALSSIAKVRDPGQGSQGPDDVAVLRLGRQVPVMALEVPPAVLQLLRHLPFVEAVEADLRISGGLTEMHSVIQSAQVYSSYGLSGAGVTVAVLDSGVDTDHTDLAGAIVAQKCFTQSDCEPGNVNESDSAEDEHGHGTHVTGILASRGNVAPAGLAPAVNVVAVRVLDHLNRGWTSDWVAGLDWVYDNLGTYPVSVVNMSLVTDALYSGVCDQTQSSLAAAANLLHAAGVTLVACTGNDSATASMGAPACVSSVVAVGATYDADDFLIDAHHGFCVDDEAVDKIACFSNRSSEMDLFAPGAEILSCYPGGGTAYYAGTSQSTPAVAGVAVLAHECEPNLLPEAIRSAVSTSPVVIDDTAAGIARARLEVPAAIAAACPCLGQTDGALCPGGACLAGRCVPAEACVTSPDCDDGDSCTEDICQAGGCIHALNGACPVGAGTYELRSVHSGRCLTVANGSFGNGANVEQSWCSGHSYQRWQVLPRPEGTYRLRAEHSAKCLRAVGNPGAAGDNIQQGRCVYQRSKWWLNDQGGGRYRLENKKTTLCAEVTTMLDGGNVQQQSCASTDGQQYRLVVIGGS